MTDPRAIVAALAELRAQRAAIDARMHTLEVRLCAAVERREVRVGRHSALTRRVLETVRAFEATSAATIAAELGADPKAVHNALATLHRGGLVERVARGRFRAVSP